MPTRSYYRIWCKECNDFTLHERTSFEDETIVCRTCDTNYSEILLSEIPEEKIVEQRKRYRDKKSMSASRLIQNILSDAMSQTSSDTISESDAGQKAIDDQNAEDRQLKLDWIREQKEKAKAYKGLNRNDKCICGSDLKYKKCCLKKIQIINNYYG